jgi:hypothetical protein
MAGQLRRARRKGMRSANFGGDPGPGVDIQGMPVLDPTANVLGLVEAAIQRQDDLRRAWAEKADAEIRAVREIVELRSQYDEKLRASDQLLREAESRRLDAIRTVDVSAVAQAANVSATQATTLATQVATSAETLRNAAAASAQVQAAALASALDPLQVAIAALQKAQYETAGGKTQTLETGTGSRAWVGLAIAAIAAVIGCSGLGLSIVGVVITLLLRR